MRTCNKIDCNRETDFAIYGDFGHPEDVTDACEDHVGELLGTPEWAVKMYGRESQSWTVIPVCEHCGGSRRVASAHNHDQTVFVPCPSCMFDLWEQVDYAERIEGLAAVDPQLLPGGET